VLAVGNYPPADPGTADREFFTSSTRYVRDPWAPGALAAVDRSAATLLVGSGLTMIDIVLELRALGVTAPCVAVSRHGLLPLPHRDPPPSPDYAPPPPLHDGPATTRAYVRAVRQHVCDAAARGVDWRDVIASLRPVTPALWDALSLDERRRFLRHVRPFWDVHRHRLAPQLHEAFAALHRAGHISVLAGRIVELRDTPDHVAVRIRPRGGVATIDMKVGTVINCTGPAGNTQRLRDPLFDDLRTRGLVACDPLGLGIETSSTGAVIGADGRVSPALYYVGPFLKARDWEATAVPELRRWARDVASHVIESLRAVAPRPIQRRESVAVGVEVSRDTLESLVRLVQQAGGAILSTARGDKEIKADGSPVTSADRAAHQIICRELALLDPSIPIVSEEAPAPLPADRSRWRRYWLVDPLDGTKEFLAGHPEFTVNIALIDDGEPVLGVIGVPALQTVYFAGRGLGSWRRTVHEPDVRLYARAPANGARLRIVESRSHPSPELEDFLSRLPVGERTAIGSSLKFCRIAEGLADCYPRLGPTMAWDVAAGDCVFRNASDGPAPHASPLRYDARDFRQPGFVIGFTPERIPRVGVREDTIAAEAIHVTERPDR
jgi:3'(2'),5'-bisphosphate nucleotidase